MTTATATVISLELDHAGRECRNFAGPLFLQLRRGNYDECSVLDLDGSLADWEAEHRTARKRAWRAERLGYRFDVIERHLYADDIYEINTSLPERQGRRMDAAYWERPSDAPDPRYPCRRHSVATYGVLEGERLRAYSWIYRAGRLALVSSILGHAAHLARDVMFLLMRGVIERELPLGGFLVYNRHDSGTDGLRYFKERNGFGAREVVWAP